MRIIGGAKRGLKLQAPLGDQTRPTLERTREDIMNILENGKFRGVLHQSNVADVFAGSGSVGLEMLSRGARCCTFFESSSDALKALNANIKKFQICTMIVRKDALKPGNAPAFDVVFMDAPYNQDLTKKAFKAFLSKGLINKDTLVVIQVAKTEDIPETTPFVIIDARKMGGAKVAFLKAPKLQENADDTLGVPEQLE